MNESYFLSIVYGSKMNSGNYIQSRFSYGTYYNSGNTYEIQLQIYTQKLGGGGYSYLCHATFQQAVHSLTIKPFLVHNSSFHYYHSYSYD